MNDPIRYYMQYGTRARGEKSYVVREGVPHTGPIVFQSDIKSRAIAEAQTRNGFEPADGSEGTYWRQLKARFPETP